VSKYPRLKSGTMSYKDYVKLLTKARTAHNATLSAANDVRKAAKEARIRQGTDLGDQAINTRALVNYCEAYAAKMAAVEEAFDKV
jgi:hypothetical protein